MCIHQAYLVRKSNNICKYSCEFGMEKGAECGKVSEKARDMCGTLKGILTGGDKSKNMWI